MIRLMLKGFYTINRFAQNFYWIMYIRYLMNYEVTKFGHFMGFVSILYAISNAVYYTTKVQETDIKLGKKPKNFW